MTALVFAILALAAALLHVGATVDGKSLLIAATKTQDAEALDGLKEAMLRRGIMAGASALAAALLAIAALATLLLA